MRSSILQIVLATMVIALGVVVEQSLPKFAHVGVPVLLAAVQVAAVRRTWLGALLFALAAGAAEDAISSLPMLTSASYFIGVAALSRWSDLPRGAMILTYPLYQPWIWIWVANPQGNVFARILFAFPIGMITVWLADLVLIWLKKEAAIDEGG